MKKTGPWPYAIKFTRLGAPVGRCGYDGCRHRATWRIEWVHVHRGLLKHAERTRCEGHAGYFARKHRVKDWAA